MMFSEPIPSAVCWHEGMLLSPQHFQEQDRRTEALLGFHAQQANPYNWGVLRLEIDEARLADHTLRLTAVEAVLPDGLTISYRDRSGAEEQNTTPLEINLYDHVQELKTAPRKVYLGVVRHSEAGTGDGDLRRWRSVAGEPITDHLAGGKVRIPRLEPQLHLFLGRPSDRFSAIPLMELTLKGNLPTRTDFHPPVAAVARHPEIQRICRDLIAVLRRKANHLSGLLSADQNGDENYRRNTAETLQHLVAGLPLFETLLAALHIHPFQLYQALVQLMSSLVPLSRSKVPPQPAVYDHNNPAAAFREVKDYIGSVLEERIHEDFRSEMFQKEGDMYVIEFQPEWEGCQLVLGFTKETGIGEREVQAWVNGALIGNRRAIPTLRRNRVLGFKRNHAEKLPGLTPGRDMVLFPLAFDEQELRPGEDLVISPSAGFAGDLTPPHLTLFVRTEAEDQT